MTRSASPDAFWFGPPERRAFGWYHAPLGQPRDMAVVLCPPLGHEMLCTHRAYRHLAEQLRAHGFPVLRFDYHGTGDSAGTDHDGNRVPDWLATIDDAIDLIRKAGAARVTLFGIRIGGTFATTVALRRDDVDALALVAPSVSGATYLRELRAMHKLRDRGENRPPFHGQRDGDEEFIGFVFRRETVDALSRLDLRTIETARSLPVVIVPRDDLPGAETKIAARLQGLGLPVDVINACGYSALAADDPYVADVPHALWTAVTQWIDGVARHAADAPRLESPPARITVSGGVAERAMRFGDSGRLFGVLSEPASSGASDLAVVITNTGANCRVGPNRLGVTLARQLASRGHAVLRMDLGGIGDSAVAEGTSENDLYARHSIDDVRASIDVLANHGYRRFVTMGLARARTCPSTRASSTSASGRWCS